MALVLQNGAGSSASGPSSSKGKRPLYTSNLLPFTDALPYYDREIDSDAQLRARVEREVEREVEKMRKGGKGKEKEKEIDEKLGKTFAFTRLSPLILQEFERVSRQQPAPTALDTARFQLPAPEAGEKASEEEWDAALRNSQTQVALQELRMSNVELLKQFGSNAWRLHNFQQEAFLKNYSDAEKVERDETTAINRKRKESQTKVGEEGKLGTYERRWAELVSNNLQVEVANITASYEIQDLKAKRRRLEEELEKLDREEEAE